MQSLPSDLTISVLDRVNIASIRLISEGRFTENWKTQASNDLFKRKRIFVEIYVSPKAGESRLRISTEVEGEDLRENIDLEELTSVYRNKTVCQLCISDHDRSCEVANLWPSIKFSLPDRSSTPIDPKRNVRIFDHVFKTGCEDVIVDIIKAVNLSDVRLILKRMTRNPIRKLSGFYIAFSSTVAKDFTITMSIILNHNLKRLYISLPESNTHKWPVQEHSVEMWTQVEKFLSGNNQEFLGIVFPNSPPKAMDHVLKEWEKRPENFKNFKWRLFWFDAVDKNLFPHQEGDEMNYVRHHKSDSKAKAVYSFGNLVQFKYE